MFKKKMDKAIELLKNTVSIYSISEGEKEVSEYLVSEMSSLGFKAYRDKAGNAVGEIGNGEKTVLLVGHIDTVPGNIKVMIEGNKLYGRGSVDAKGPFCTFVMAAAKAKLNCKIVCVGAVEEEAASSKGARHVINKYAPDYIIIGEPSGYDAITLGYKGRLLIDYSLVRDNFHTANAELSALDEAFMFYDKIKDWAHSYNKEKTKIFEQLQMTARDIDYTSDGFKNTVLLRVGFRLPVGFDVREFRKYISSIKKDAKITDFGEENAIKADKNNALVRAFLKTLRSHKLEPAFKLKTGTSDMNVLGDAFPNVPILAYGPGDSDLDHTPDENINIEEYLKAIDILKEVLELLN